MLSKMHWNPLSIAKKLLENKNNTVIKRDDANCWGWCERGMFHLELRPYTMNENYVPLLFKRRLYAFPHRGV